MGQKLVKEKSVEGKIQEELAEKTQAGKKLCPFVQDPYDDCYIVNMISQNIEKVIMYCGSNFEDCEIYKKNTNGKHLTKWNVII